VISHQYTRNDQNLAPALDGVIADAIRLSTDSAETPLRRIQTIAILGEAEPQTVGTALVDLLDPRQPKDVQVAAARALGRFGDAQTAAALASRDKWTTYSPPVRDLVLNALLNHPDRIAALLDGVEQGYIPVWSIPSDRRKQLLHQDDGSIRARAEKLFSNQEGSDRMQVYREYKPVLNLKGESRNGHLVFSRICAGCHQVNGEGASVGPDLTGVKNQPPEALLYQILVPDAETYPGFQNYECRTQDGRTFGGIMVAENESAITLRRALGDQDVVSRDQIVSLRASGTSLMPGGLEKAMSRQELADLLEFLRNPL
jgi:putative heme-binding domain-containing protein